RPLEIDGIIVATQCELPAFVKGGSAAAAEVIAPGHTALDRPTFILVLPVIQCAVQDHLGVNVEIAILFEALITTSPATRQEHIHDRTGWVDLELVITRFVAGRFEEKL